MLYNKAKKENINLISIPIRHLGTEKSHELYFSLEKYLEENGVDLLFDTIVSDIITENGVIKGVKVKPSNKIDDESANLDDILADNVVLAVGRKGANWLSNLCQSHFIKTSPGIVDIGIRYELPDDVMKDVNKYMYEGKFIGKPEPFRDKVSYFLPKSKWLCFYRSL